MNFCNRSADAVNDPESEVYIIEELQNDLDKLGITKANYGYGGMKRKQKQKNKGKEKEIE